MQIMLSGVCSLLIASRAFQGVAALKNRCSLTKIADKRNECLAVCAESCDVPLPRLSVKGNSSPVGVTGNIGATP
jgi:hypothetical protein